MGRAEMTPHDEAGHVAALLRQLPADSPAVLALITRLRNLAIAIVQPVADRLADAEHRRQRERFADRVQDFPPLGPVDLTDYDTVAMVALSTLGESGESGERPVSARVAGWRTAGESWRKAGELTPRQRSAVDLLRLCAEVLHRGRLDPVWLVPILHALAGMDADRDLGAQTRSIRAAAGRKGIVKRKRDTDKLTDAINREVARLADRDPRTHASAIATKLGVTPKTVRERLRKKRTET